MIRDFWYLVIDKKFFFFKSNDLTSKEDYAYENINRTVSFSAIRSHHKDKNRSMCDFTRPKSLVIIQLFNSKNHPDALNVWQKKHIDNMSNHTHLIISFITNITETRNSVYEQIIALILLCSSTLDNRTKIHDLFLSLGKLIFSLPGVLDSTLLNFSFTCLTVVLLNSSDELATSNTMSLASLNLMKTWYAILNLF